MNRQTWLEKAVDILRHDFWQIGETIPEVMVSDEWPWDYTPHKCTLAHYKSILETDGSETEVEITIHPDITDALIALSSLVHELVHAAVGGACGHAGEFLRVAAAIGLDDGGPTACAEEVLLERLREIQEILGMYPEEVTSDNVN